MSDTGNALSSGLGAAGAAHAIVHGGRAYSFRPFGQAMKDQFQKELYRVCREKAPALPSVAEAADPAAALDARLSALERQFLAGGFEMESGAGHEFLSRPEGKALLLRLIIARPDGDTDEQFADFLRARGVEAMRLMDLVLCESMPGYRAARERRAAGETPPGRAEGNGPAPRPTPRPGGRKKHKGKKTRR